MNRCETTVSLEQLMQQIQHTLPFLGKSRVNSVAYDSAWVSRLAQNYSGHGFDEALRWLREHQRPDGSWGAEITHYHDRLISTLSAIVALRLGSQNGHDEQRIRRGEHALWQVATCLDRDDSDTVGFPVLSVALAKEARQLGLNVPEPKTRYAIEYNGRVNRLLTKPQPNWRKSPLIFSIEALTEHVSADSDFQEANGSVGTSPAATAALVLVHHRDSALEYLKQAMVEQGDGGAPALLPIDTYEATWALNHLRLANAAQPNDPSVRQVLNFLWQMWKTERASSFSSYFSVPDLDDTAAVFAVLHWGGYPVDLDVFVKYEVDDHFCCFPGETNPSVSAHVRLLLALRLCETDPRFEHWSQKIVGALRRLEGHNRIWWDKWHASPYYVNCAAVHALHGIADDLVEARINWIAHSQNTDGGWGYHGFSTPEESAYCLDALLFADRTIRPVDPVQLQAAASYLESHFDDDEYSSLWIGKSLYTPYYLVKSAILASLYCYKTNQKNVSQLS